MITDPVRKVLDVDFACSIGGAPTTKQSLLLHFQIIRMMWTKDTHCNCCFTILL
jgi:hypothetical protein